MKKENEIRKSIVFFDGACAFCDSAVQYIIKHDSKKKFLFASLESDYAKKYFLAHSIQADKISSIVLIEGEKIYFKSSAALHISKHLDSYRKLFFIGIFIPPFIRDYFYEFISRNRYRISTKKDFCEIPNKQIQERFL
ncbi:MAG: DCC1-like thiol-disulfide oxidoreductase family protein [Bacteroidia bacterium]